MLAALVWKRFRLLFLLLQLFHCQFWFCFHEQTDGWPITWNDPKYISFWVISFLILLYFYVDACMDIYTYFDKLSITSVNLSSFCSSGKFVWHCFGDLVFLLPYEVIGYACGYPYFARLGLLRLCRLVHAFEYWRVDVYPYLYKCGIQSPSMLRMSFCFVGWCTISHTFASCYYLLGLSLLRRGQDRNWLSHVNLIVLHESGQLNMLHSVEFIYIKSLYFAVQTMTTTGYGDITAYATEETWLVLVFIYCSFLLMVVTTSNNVLVFSSLDLQKSIYNNKVADLYRYARYRRLPTNIVNRIKSLYHYEFRVTNGKGESVLDELPGCLQVRAKLFMVKQVLKCVEEVGCACPRLLNAVVFRLQTLTYSPSDVILQSSSLLTGLFVVSHGVVTDGSKTTLSRGDSFGNKALYSAYRSDQTFIALTFCEIWFLEGHAYRKLCAVLLSKSDYVKNIKHRVVLQESSHNFVSNENNDNNDRAYQKGKLMTDLRADGQWSICPHGNLFGIRSIVVGCCIVFYTVSNAVLVSNITTKHFGSNMMGVIIVGYVADVIMLIDIMGKMYLYSFLHDGVKQSDLTAIYEKFFSEHNIVIECVAVVPFDIPLLCFHAFGAYVLVRLCRLLHCRHLSTVWEHCMNFARKHHLKISPGLSRHVGFAYVLFMLLHWAACLWMLACNSSTNYFHYDLNWEINTKLNPMLSVNYKWMCGTTQYFRSLYWTFSTFTAIGYSDCLPTNRIEVIANIVIMFLGCFFLNALIGCAGNVINEFSKHRVEHLDKVKEIDQLFDILEIPADLKNRIYRYYAYMWDMHEGVDEVAVLSSLTIPLKNTVIDYVIGASIRSIPFFSVCDAPMQQMVVGLLRRRVFLDNDAIMTSGEKGKEMFVIERGIVTITSFDRKTTFVKLKSGDYFGESCLLKVTIRAASAYAVGYCDTYCLTKESFHEVSHRWPLECVCFKMSCI